LILIDLYGEKTCLLRQLKKKIKYKFLFTPSRIYQLLIGAVGLYLIFSVAHQWSIDSLWLYFVWSLFSTAAELKPITMPSKDQLTVSFAIHISALILYGAPMAILISTIANIIVDAIGRRGLKKMLFNVSQYAITIYLSWMAYHYLSPNADILHIRNNFLAMFASCLTYVVINYLLVSTIISLSLEKRLLRILTRDLKLELLHFASLTPVSILIVILYSVEPLTIIIVFLPLYVAHFSFENYINLRTETQRTIEVLADIIDKRDSYTSEHSFRVANYCKKIAQELNLPPGEIETLDTAARVHDLGKISIPDNILLKNGRLTPAEREIILSHSQVGYDILNNLRFYKSGAKLVRCHHEMYDGNGYPQGLDCNSIPLGARILAVADAFDAMTSDRPYRKAMLLEEAIKELVRCSGTQFDPNVVKAFVSYLIENKDN
jgi:HD-GYP domain-containing protein (c-di-GMP phosphodiesterase class II)